MHLTFVTRAIVFLLAQICLSAPTYSASTLAWKACPAGLVAPNATMKCSSLEVPMDWDRPDWKERVTLVMAKLPARDPANRIGNLFYNPGGPGAQVTQALSGIYNDTGMIHKEYGIRCFPFNNPKEYLYCSTNNAVLDRFDIIGVDLRGSGYSDPIICDASIYNDILGSGTLFPSTETAFNKAFERNLALRRSCIEKTRSPLIEFMDTVSIAKDHEAVRQALGNDKVTWLGQSYGTRLATQYAELFPETIRAMLLDGCLSSAESETSVFVEGAVSNEAVLRQFFAWCEQQNSTICPLNAQNRNAEDIWEGLMQRSAHDPIPAPDCISGELSCTRSNVTAANVRVFFQENAYHPAVTFPFIAQVLAEAAFNNNASLIAPQAISTDAYQASYQYANTAIGSQDAFHNSTPAYERFKQLFSSSETPLLMGVSAFSETLRNCLGWPAPKRNPPHQINIPNTLSVANVLTVNNLYDPATCYSNAVSLQQQIGPDRALFLSRNATGHTTYFQPEAFDGQTVAAMNKYLLTLNVPKQASLFQN